MSSRTDDGWFRGFAEKSATALGKPTAFLIVFGIVVLWGLAGPVFHYSEQWQSVINTGTNIITFLMVFLLQNTQTRDSRAIHLKLNELLRSISEARNDLVSAENLPDARLDQLKHEYAALAEDCAVNDDATADAVSKAKSLRDA